MSYSGIDCFNDLIKGLSKDYDEDQLDAIYNNAKTAAYNKKNYANNSTQTNIPTKKLLVMDNFPQFKDDYSKLIDNGYMKENGDKLKWLKSQRLLAWYFGKMQTKTKNKKWQLIEELFSVYYLAQAYQKAEVDASDPKSKLSEEITILNSLLN